jgi:cycloartenol synthase
MWKFLSASDSGGHPHLTSLNGHKGRQTWEFDPNAGTPEQRARVEQLRAAFTANRHVQRHSADELLRLQCADKIAAKQHAPPTEPIAEGQVPSAERVEQHLKGAISFYECLQQDDGHFPGMVLQAIIASVKPSQNINIMPIRSACKLCMYAGAQPD